MYCRVYIAGEVTSDPVEMPGANGKTMNCFYVKTIQDIGSDNAFRPQEICFLIGLEGKANAKARMIRKGCSIFAEGILMEDHLAGGPNLVPRKDSTPGKALTLRVHSIRIMDYPAGKAA